MDIDEDPYADIRPYRDDEVAVVIRRLLKDQGFFAAIAAWRMGSLYQWLPGIATLLARRWLTSRLAPLDTVHGVQMQVKPLLEGMLAKTATLSFDGLDRLDPEQSWLFISNHRDITLDPALTNHVLHASGHRTVSIAIGDNLLQEPWVADLMRLNKSFIVRRSLSGPRELLAASRQLAGFIRSTIANNEGPVWIAQREGRAKDGIDSTEPAVVKMLTLARDRATEEIGDVLPRFNIVPLAISYEIDPCDGAKAAELLAGAEYVKSDREDVRSIAQGITGQKGSVHLSFGEPLPETAGDVSAVVEAIDTHVRTHYRLFESALWAWQRLENTSALPAVEVHKGTLSRAQFSARIDALPEKLRPVVLAMYANPLRRALGEL